MLEGKALMEDTDMPVKMQIQAMTSASQALDLYDVFDCKSIAAHIKKGMAKPPQSETTKEPFPRRTQESKVQQSPTPHINLDFDLSIPFPEGFG
ncbi:hypothetical protein HHK36_006180 [Tetracentron sinense]|uniref:Dynein light chain n=1 Tax=Tetracentron sinense TaxID=13715 RepID=A0A834ZJY5_TETSI|nr:hypothetical protein HHK36_006180 [Tetracentron sinense]